MKSIKDFLASIGFGKNEIEVYLALSEAGTSPVLEISKKTKIHRSNIYDALRNLMSEGMVFEIKSEKKLFYARPIEELIDYFDQKQSELNEIVKEYKSKYSKASNESTIKLTKGVFSLRESIKSLLGSNSDILVYGIPVKTSEIIGPMLQDFHRERIKKQIGMKHIYNSDSVDRINYLNKLKFTEARILPAKYDSNVTTSISDDRVMFFLWGDKNGDITVLEIKNPGLAEPYRNYFDVLWKKAKDLPAE